MEFAMLLSVSTAITCGILITVIHNAGLVTMVTTLNTGVVLKELLGTFEPTSSVASLCSCKSRHFPTYLHGYYIG